MKSHIRAAVTLFALLTLLTGVAYPALVTGIGQGLFRDAANGSLLKGNGSALIGQPFDASGYFWGRPSATNDQPYNGLASGGSNQGPTNPALLKDIGDRVEAMRKAHPDQTGRVPIDLVAASGSGLDPHISPAAAEYQVTRIARERSKSVDEIRRLVAANTEGRTFGVLGEPRVNVLKLNLKLDGK